MGWISMNRTSIASSGCSSKKFASSPQHLDQLCGLPNPLFNQYQGSYPVSFPKSVPPLTVCTHSSQICSDDWCEQSQISIWPFPNYLHHFLTCCTLIMPSQCTYELAVNFGDGADGGGTSFTHIKLNTLQTSLWDSVVYITATACAPNSIWLTD